MTGRAPRLVRDRDELSRACGRLRRSEFVALDTEFIRERTYLPELCVVQLASEDEQVLVDALALEDLEPLRDLLLDERRVKVVHAGRQDLAIFVEEWDELPWPVFDTQVAAALLGIGESVGYASLVEHVLGLELGKGHARTDWKRRPLSEAQLRYAREDVVHLAELYPVLLDRLEAAGRLEWMEEEARALREPGLLRTEPADAWKSVKGARRLPGSRRAALEGLAAWREREARARNLPRRWLVPDEALVELARRGAEEPRDLERIGGLPERLRRRDAQVLLEILRDARSQPAPSSSRRERIPWQEQRALVESFSALLKARTAENGVSTTLVATRADLELVAARGPEADVAVLRGWRRELVGRDLLALWEEQHGGSVDGGPLAVR